MSLKTPPSTVKAQPSFRPHALCAIAVSLFLAACGGASSEKQLASAKAYLDKKDTRSAIVELKNSLQSTPDSAEARYLLGMALLESGDAVAAVVELRKALSLQRPEVDVLPPLVRGLNASGEFRKSIDEFSYKVLPEGKAQAALKSGIATAYLLQGNVESAQREVAASMKAEPDNVPALIVQARLAARKSDADAALALVDAALRKEPAHEEALVMRGDLLLQGKSDVEGALGAYRQAVAARPSSMAAHSGVIGVLLDKSDFDGAGKQLAELKKTWPTHPQTRWYEARLALQRGDYKEARKISEQLLSKAPNDARFLYLVGVTDFMSGSNTQAEYQFGKALQQTPGSVAVRLMLARTELRLGQAAKALAVVQPIVDRDGAAADVLSVAGQAHLMQGELAKAQEFFARAAKANPADTRSRTALALTKLRQGGDPAALNELQDIAAVDKGVAADLGLINALAQRKDFDAALKAVDRLAKKQPGAPLPPYLQGMVLLAKGDAAGGRASFERALVADPKYFLAVVRLAALDLADKKPELAKARFDRLLAIDPKNQQAMLALIDLKIVTGAKKEELTPMFVNAVNASPNEAGARLRLIDHQLRLGDTKAALTAARDAAAAVPQDARVTAALGTAQMVAGEYNQASVSFKELASLQPNSPAGFMGMAEAQMALKDETGALQSLKRAAALAPRSVPVQRALISRLVLADRHTDALDASRALQKLLPTDAAGYVFEGDVEAARKNWLPAIAAYRTALGKAKVGDNVVKLHSALLAAKRVPEANQVAAEWLEQNPKDLNVLSRLGETAIVNKDLATAESRYRALLRRDPAQPAALNNLAWLLVEQQKAGALEFAEKANSLAPDQPPFMDTLASALAAQNQVDKALALQKKAVELQPDTPEFRLHLARLHIRVGDKPAARTELDRLAKLGVKYPNQEEVTQLLKTL